MKRPLTLLALTLLANFAQAQNTTNNYTGPATGSLLTPSNWSRGTVPTVSDDAVFPSGAATGIRTINNGALTVGSFNVSANSGTFTIRNETNSTTSSLTLGGPGNLGNALGTSLSDLLVAASGSTLTITGSSGTAAVLNLILGQSGNFNPLGTGIINISSVISDGGNNFAITKTGTGTLTLSGANTYGGGMTLSDGRLNINNGGTSAANSALGTGTFTINGGSISNTSGAAVTVGTNNAQVWAGNFTYIGTSGTNNLNLGTGNVTLTGNRQVIVTGTTSTFTVGGTISDGGSGFSLTKGAGGAGTLILANTNTYNGGTIVAAGTLVAGADGALGGGNVSLTAASVTLTLQGGVMNNYIADTATLSIGFTTDIVNLNFNGSDTIAGLIVAGVQQAPGVYGGASSGAPNQLAQLMGTGTFTVIPEPATYVLMGLGALVCGQQFRRRRKL
jgi:autotransporter-associated beta strand protein